MKRIVAAFLIAPLSVPLAAAATLANWPPRGDQWMLVVVMAMFTYGMGIVGGVPALFVFRRLRWDRLWQFGLGGAAIGIGMIVVGSPAALLRADNFVAIYGAIGAVSAAVFWFIGIWRNPWFRQTAVPDREAAAWNLAASLGSIVETEFRRAKNELTWRRLAETVRDDVVDPALRMINHYRSRLPSTGHREDGGTAAFPLFATASVVGPLLGMAALLVLETTDVGKALNGYAGLLLALTVVPLAVLALASGLVLGIVSIVRRERWRAAAIVGIALPLALGLYVLLLT